MQARRLQLEEPSIPWSRTCMAWLGGVVSFRSFDVRGDLPHMPRRIDNPPDAIAPELVGHRNQNPRPSDHRPLDHRVHIFDEGADNN